MSWIIDLSCLVVLSILAFQDFMQRQFSWFFVPILLILFIVNGLSQIEGKQLLRYFLMNSAFILLQLLAITAYFSIKNKKLINIVNTSLGLGDILFFFVICAAFTPVSFIHFYLSGLVFALLIYLSFKLFKASANGEIPLAGLMALWFIVCFLFFRFAGWSFYNDAFLVNFYLNE